jgi:hypothetical protein
MTAAAIELRNPVWSGTSLTLDIFLTAASVADFEAQLSVPVSATSIVYTPINTLRVQAPSQGPDRWISGSYSPVGGTSFDNEKIASVTIQFGQGVPSSTVTLQFSVADIGGLPATYAKSLTGQQLLPSAFTPFSVPPTGPQAGLPDTPQIMPVWEGTSTIVDRSDDAILFDFSPSDGLSSLAAGNFKLVSRLSREEPVPATITPFNGSNPETATFTVTATDLAGPGFVLNAGDIWLFAGQYELEQARIAGNASSISTQILATVLASKAAPNSLPFTLSSAAGGLTLTWKTTGDQPDATLLKRIEFDGQTLYGPVAGATSLDSTTTKTFDQATNKGTVTHKIAVPSIATPAKYQIGIEGFGPVLLDLNPSDHADSIKNKLVTALSAVTQPFAITASGSELVITWSNLSGSDHQPWPEGPSTFAKVEPLMPGPESRISRSALEQAIDLANYPNVFGFRAEIAEPNDPDANDTPDTGTSWVYRPMPLVDRIDSSRATLVEGQTATFTVRFNDSIPTSQQSLVKWRLVHDLQDGTSNSDFTTGANLPSVDGSLNSFATFSGDGKSATITLSIADDSTAENWESFRIEVGSLWGTNNQTFVPDMNWVPTFSIESSDQTGPSDTPATGTLGVTGTAQEGGQLTASLSNVIDVDGAPTISYRWQQYNGTSSPPAWVDIVGATSSSLSIPGDQSFVGRQVRVVAKTTDSKGGITEFFGASQTVANVNDPPGGAVTIEGTPAPGQTLTASHNITDADGIGTINYQWKANDTSINGATQPTFTLTSAEVGKTITVTASYTDQQNTVESVTSLQTSTVTATLTTLSGKVVDGYLAGATVFADANGNFIKDPNEASAVTAADGGYTLVNPRGPITAFGGIDTSTGMPFVGGLMAPEGYTTVTPLTTLVAIYLNAKRSALGGSSFTEDHALTDIAQVTGISKDMLTRDVYAAASTDPAALAAQKYAAQLATLTQAAVALHDNTLDNGPDQQVVTGMISGLMTKINEALAVPSGAGRLQPASLDCVTAVLTAAAGSGGTVPADLDAVATAVSTLNTAIMEVSTSSATPDALASILKLQGVFQSTMLSQIADDATTFSASSYDTTAELSALAATQPVRVSALPSNAIVGTVGDDVGGARLVGTNVGEEMLGLAGDDVLLGLGGNDTLTGGPHQDALFGGDGDDRATDLAMGDIFIGGPGTDRAIFSGSSSDYSVSLANPTQRSTVIGTAFAAAEFGHEPGLPLYRVVSKIGATGEIFVQAEEFQFGSSNPVSPDSLISTAPTGIVVAPSGGTHTTLSAAIASANAGDLITVSGSYAETATTPILITKNNLKILLEGTGAALNFKLAESAEASGVENLTLLGNRSANVTGNAANNLIVGNEGANRIDGLAGNDKIAGRGGDDDLYGGVGNDVIDGGMGWDNVFGGSGNDRLLSGEGGAASTIVGARGSDLLSGGSGNDILIVATEDASSVQLLGGSGNDLYRFVSIDDGRDNNGNLRNVASDPRPLQLKTFIADLTAGDGIDMGALVRGSTGTTPVGSLVSGEVQSGDLPFEFGSGKANAGLKVIGLTSAGGGGGTPTFSPSTGLRDDVLGSLKVALASATEVNDAISRGSNTSSSFHTAAQFEPINTLLTNFSPLYQGVL